MRSGPLISSAAFLILWLSPVQAASFFYLQSREQAESVFGPYVLVDHQEILQKRYRIRTLDDATFRVVENRSGQPVTPEPVGFAQGAPLTLGSQTYTLVTGEAYTTLNAKRNQALREQRKALLGRSAVTWGIEQAMAIDVEGHHVIEDDNWTASMQDLIRAYSTRIRLLEKTLEQNPQAENRAEAEALIRFSRKELEAISGQKAQGRVWFRETWMRPAEIQTLLNAETLYPKYGLFFEVPNEQAGREWVNRFNLSRRSENREKLQQEIRDRLQNMLDAIGETMPLDTLDIISASYRYDKERKVHFVSFRTRERTP